MGGLCILYFSIKINSVEFSAAEFLLHPLVLLRLLLNLQGAPRNLHALAGFALKFGVSWMDFS